MLSAERIGAQSGPVPPAWRVIGEWYYICTNDCKMHISHHHLSNLSITNRTARFRCTCHSLYHGKIQMTSHTQVYRSGKVTLQFDRQLIAVSTWFQCMFLILSQIPTPGWNISAAEAAAFSTHHAAPVLSVATSIFFLPWRQRHMYIHIWLQLGSWSY